MEEFNSLKELARLYPHLTREQLEEANQNIEEYLKVVVGIYERVISEPTSAARLRMLLAEQRAEQQKFKSPRGSA